MKKFLLLCATFFIMIVASLGCSQNAEAAESSGYYIKVNKGTNVVTVYKSDGTPYKAMICSTGTATPTGTFYTPAKYRWKVLMGPCYGQYSTRITGGVLFHSVWYYTNGDKSSMSVSAYNKLGTTCSHGCVRLRVKDAKWIYDHCPLGTKVIIFNGSSKDDPLGKPSFTKISTGAYTAWDPTDPDPSNPWNAKKPTITVKSTNVEYGSTFKLSKYVTVKDSAGNKLTSGVTYTGKVNTKKLGTYKIKVTAKDSLGNKRTKTIKFKVVDTKKPTLTGVKGNSSAALNKTYNLLSGVKAKAKTGKSLTSKIKVSVKNSSGKSVKVTNGKVKFTKTGKYKVTYKVTGVNGKTTKKTVTYKVVNKKVALSVKSTVTLEYGSSYNAYDYVKSLKSWKGTSLSIKKNVTYKSTVKTTKIGTYKITYTATQNSKSYTKSTKTTTVEVVNKKAPVFSGVPTSTVTLDYGADYNLMDGISAASTTGVSLNKYIVVYVDGTEITDSNYTLDTSVSGTYKIKYSVTIPNGKTTTKSVTIVVNEDPQILEDAKTAALEELAEYFSNIVESDYEAADYALVKEYYNNAVAAIDSAESEDELETIVSDCKASIEAVESISWGTLV